MKRSFLCGLVLIVLGTANSCIFEEPDDRFFRTLWKSSETPLGPLPVTTITLEFLCGQNVSIKTDENGITSYGTYESDDKNVIFNNLSLTLEGHTVTFIDADISGESLVLHWKTEDSGIPLTTAMHRLSSYE